MLTHLPDVLIYLRYDGFSCRLSCTKYSVLTKHSGCIRLRPVSTLTPVEVWSASWSKGTKTKLPHVNVCAPLGWQAAAHSSARRWQTLTLIQAGFPGGITKSAGMHLWQVTQFTEVFSPFTRTHLRRCRIWERSIFNLSPWGLVVLWLFLLERQNLLM